MREFLLTGWVALLLCQNSLLSASPPDTVFYQFPTTVVTASRYRQPLRFTSENVAIITQDELSQLPAHNLLEGLNFTPGLSVRKNGGVGTRSPSSIQGSEPRHVTVLWNGIPLNDLAEGLADPVQIPLEQVGRVEIVKGPASSVWGSALGGVIQVFSPVLDREVGNKIRATGSYGKWGTHQESLGIQGGTGSKGYLLTASRTTTEGFRPRSGHDGIQLLGKAETGWGAGRLGTSYGYLDGKTEDFVQFGRAVWKQHAYTTRFGQVYYEGALHGELETRRHLFRVEREEEVRFLQVADGQVVQHGTRAEPIWGSSLQVIGAAMPYGGDQLSIPFEDGVPYPILYLSQDEDFLLLSHNDVSNQRSRPHGRETGMHGGNPDQLLGLL